MLGGGCQIRPGARRQLHMAPLFRKNLGNQNTFAFGAAGYQRRLAVQSQFHDFAPFNFGQSK